MRERLATLAFAIGALLLFITLFVRGGEAPQARTSLPTSAEAGPNGLSGAMRWLAHEHIPTRAVRERFDRALGTGPAGVASRGNLLIITLPVRTPFRATELRALEQWLRAGNTLLVLAAIADTPDWSVERGDFEDELRDLTGMTFHAVRLRPDRDALAEAAAARRRFDPAQRTTLVPNREHAYLAGVREAVAWSDFPWRPSTGQAWTLEVPRSGFMLSLARHRETGEGVLWVRARGAGTVIVSGLASLFSNRALGLADNARLLGNIVGASLGAGGAVLYDDEHQGLSDLYDPAMFYRDPRLYATLGVLTALWLTWVLGGTRLRLPVSRAPAPREAQLVRATGAFLARVLTAAAAARLMFAHFFRRVRASAARGDATAGPPWALLEHHPRIARADLEQLRGWYAQAYSGGRLPLLRLHNLMIRIERQLIA